MMKKLLILTLLAIMLTGCTNNKPEDTSSDAIEEQVEERSAEQEEDEESEEESTGVMYEYVAPTELGDDIYSFNFELDGHVYTLPVPVSEFLDNGWEMHPEKTQQTPDDMIEEESRRYSVFLVNAQGQEMSVDYENYDYENERPLKECYAVQISPSKQDYDNTIPKLNIVLPKGITAESSKEEVIAAYGEPTNESLPTMFEYWYYSPDYMRTVEISWYYETETIHNIVIANR
jgi:hypothetical protein